MSDQRSIPEYWIQQYVDTLLKLAGDLPNGLLREAMIIRADNIMELVKAYRDYDMRTR